MHEWVKRRRMFNQMQKAEGLQWGGHSWTLVRCTSGLLSRMPTRMFNQMHEWVTGLLERMHKWVTYTGAYTDDSSDA